MNKFLLCCSVLIFALNGYAQADDYREFTGQNGQTMRAKPVAVIGKKVRIQRDDGNEFTVDATIFSAEDQKWLSEWTIIFLAKNDRLLEVNTREGSTKAQKSDTGATEYKRWQSFYKVILENDSDIPLKDVRIEYRYFKFDDQMAADRRSDGDMEKVSGELTIKLLPARKKMELETEKVSMQSSDLKPGWDYVGGGSEKSKDKLAGIRMKIYSGKLLLMDYSAPSTLREKNVW